MTHMIPMSHGAFNLGLGLIRASRYRLTEPWLPELSELSELSGHCRTSRCRTVGLRAVGITVGALSELSVSDHVSSLSDYRILITTVGLSDCRIGLLSDRC